MTLPPRSVPQMKNWLILCVVVALAACESAPSRTSSSSVRALDPSSEAAQELPPEAKALVEQIQTGRRVDSDPNDYRVGALDLLTVEVFQVPELSRKVRVNTSGRIGLPLVGTIAAEGMTVEELEAEIAKRLAAEYMQDPNVSVFIDEYVSQRITIEGAIKSPGLYPIKGRTSLLQSIAMAGGTADIANESQIAVFRNTDKGRVIGMFDLRQIRAGTANDPEIRADDIIVVDRSGPRSFLRRMIETMPLLTFGAIF